ncbi:hypothetical protein SALCHL_000528 [Streptomyces albus subsp. chlorinus]|nr:hypothetical protein [Streptomyces albus]
MNGFEQCEETLPRWVVWARYVLLAIAVGALAAALLTGVTKG